MKLIVKFNLVLCVVFAIAFVLAGLFTHALLQRNAKAEIEEPVSQANGGGIERLAGPQRGA